MSRGYRLEPRPRRIRARHALPLLAILVDLTFAGLMVASPASDGVMLATIGMVFVLGWLTIRLCLWSWGVE